MDYSSELFKSRERYYSHVRKPHQRRNLMKKAGKLAATALTIGIAVEALSFFDKLAKGEAKEPNAFLNGKVEIIMSDELNVRTTPQRFNVEKEGIDNTVRWSSVDEIKTKGDKWVSVKDGKRIIIDMPAIYRPNEHNPQNTWITFEAKVNGEEERLYVNADPELTGEYVKRLEPGQIYELGGNSGADWTGTVTVEK